MGFAGRGAGLNLQPHALWALNEIGLMEEVVANGWAPTKQQYYTSDGRLIAKSPRGLAADATGFPQISIHRAVLHEILERAVEDRLGPGTIQRGVQGVAYSQTEQSVCLRCKHADGRQFDMHSEVVIGADGISSRIRKAVLRAKGKSDTGQITCGITLYRGTAIVDKVLDGQTIVVAGNSKGKLVCYPLKKPTAATQCQKQALNFMVELAEDHSIQDHLDFHHKKTLAAEEIAEELEKANGGFRLPFLDHRKLLCNAVSIRAFPMSDKNPLDSWCDGRVVLLGDAAHPMYPVGSNGASTALLDAVELASSFSRNTKNAPGTNGLSNVAMALNEYERNRRPVATSVQLACRKMLPEKVMDQVQKEVPTKVLIPISYRKGLLEALSKCQAGSPPLTSCKSQQVDSNSGGLATRVPWSNNQLLANFSPIERVLLGANGTLQRTMSAFTNTSVVVRPVMTTTRATPQPGLLADKHTEHRTFVDRAVTLHVQSTDGPCLATCTTTVVCQEELVKSKLVEHKIGIGQLLEERRKAGKKEPIFNLIAAGKRNNNVLTRQYELDIPEKVKFLIHEEIYLGPMGFGLLWARDWLMKV